MDKATLDKKPAPLPVPLRVPPAKIVFPPEEVDRVLEEMRAAITTGQLTLGKHTRAFEEAFAKMTGSAFAAAVSSGTCSLEIILRALAVKGEVIVPTNTFFATAAAVLHAGSRLRLADVSAKTLCLDLPSLQAAVTSATEAVVIVHIGGFIPPDINEIRAFCDKRKIVLLEDAAHAHGSSFNGVKAGRFGAAASFSFYPTKVITSAEGGMIVTDDAKIHEEALIYRDQGKAGFTANVHTRLGANWRMSELHAILGLSQLRHLDRFIAERQATAKIYDRRLENTVALELLPRINGLSCNYYKYPVLLKPGVDRAALKKLLRETRGVGLSGEVYELPLHKQPIFADHGKGQSFPVAEDVCRRQVCLPVFAGMTTADAEHAVDSLLAALAEGARR